MFRFRRNKSELIVLTGAIYSFVAYLTAFTLEILFLIDLTRQQATDQHLLSVSTTQADGRPPGSQIFSSSSSSSSPLSVPQQLAAYFNGRQQQQQDDAAQDVLSSSSSFANSFERFTFEAMQAHITISCLAISILYFVIFITSLALIVALIVRSTFMLLIWMCAMTTMYLPEFGLVTYVAVYSWGLGTRNGQVELAFYLLRAVLNLIFIYRAHKLFKQWNHEKNFFRLKSAGGGVHFGLGGGGGVNSPYFITGDSLTTTINPMFSSSTLNLNRYDYVRGGVDQMYAPTGGSRNTSPTTNQSVFSGASSAVSFNQKEHQDAGGSSGHGSMAGGRGRLATASLYSRQLANAKYSPSHSQQPERRFYLGADDGPTGTPPPTSRHHRRANQTPATHTVQRNESMLSINDDLDADYEMDLDYRTLNKQRGGGGGGGEQAPSARYYNHNYLYTGGGGGGAAYHHNHQQRAANHDAAMMSRSQDNLTYSTQSLDRRHLRDFGGLATEQVVLRPLGHQPFEYLHRPGSTSNLNSVGSVNPNARNGGSNTRQYHYGN